MLRTHHIFAMSLAALLFATGCPTAAPTDLLAALGVPDVAIVPADSVPDNAFAQRLRDDFPACGELRGVDNLREEVFRLVNAARAAEGLAPLRPNKLLEQQAEQYACEMITHQFFGHENPESGSTLATRASQFGYDYLVVGENLAAGQTSAQQVFSDWMNSPSHRDNILDPRFTELGIGIRAGGAYRIYWVQEFGLPRASMNPALLSDND